MSLAKQPRLTVVIATYNRPEVLKLALRSVQWQTFTDWQVIVVGDCVNDHTGAMVAGLGDERIRFMNLDENCGDQSGPNNRGMQETDSEIIALLNHDDIWFPDHLEKAVASIDAGHDLVWGRWLVVTPPEMADEVSYVADDLKYNPKQDIIPASWVHKRALFETVGPWLNAANSHAIPSQNWLFRAYRKGVSMRALPDITLAHIPANMRENVYQTGDVSEQQRLIGAIEDDAAWVERLRTDAGLVESEPGRLRVLDRIGLALGYHPREWHNLLRFRRKGRSLRRWRDKLGLKGN